MNGSTRDIVFVSSSSANEVPIYIFPSLSTNSAKYQVFNLTLDFCSKKVAEKHLA